MNDQNTVDAWQYRKLAAYHLSLAKGLAQKEDDPSGVYFSLELRRAIEAYAYSLLCNYRPEVSASDLDTWQPHAVMRALRGLDPDADKPLHLQLENTDSSFYDVGIDQRLGYRWLSENYNRLSSIVHVPTVAKINQPKSTVADIRQLCNTLVADLDFVLTQERWNFVVGNFSTIPCDCGFRLRRRAENLKVGSRIVCAMCSRVYKIAQLQNGEVIVIPSLHRFDCKFCGVANGHHERDDTSSKLGATRNLKKPDVLRILMPQ